MVGIPNLAEGHVGAINIGRVIGGGVLAGLIINVVEFVMNMFVLRDAWSEVYATMGVAEPGGAAIAGYVVLAFVLGLLIAWTYAAIRPRCGAGPGTAVKAAAVVWVAAYLVPTVGWMLMGGIGTWLVFVTLAYSIVEIVVAALAAGAVYQEGASATA